MPYDRDRHLRQMYERDCVRWEQKLHKAKMLDERFNDDRSRNRLNSIYEDMPRYEHYIKSGNLSDGSIWALILVLIPLWLGSIYFLWHFFFRHIYNFIFN